MNGGRSGRKGRMPRRLTERVGPSDRPLNLGSSMTEGGEVVIKNNRKGTPAVGRLFAHLQFKVFRLSARFNHLQSFWVRGAEHFQDERTDTGPNTCTSLFALKKSFGVLFGFFLGRENSG